MLHTLTLPLEWNLVHKTYQPINFFLKYSKVEEKKNVQNVVGAFLYYGRAVDGTMLASLSAIALKLASPTENTLQKLSKFMN